MTWFARQAERLGLWQRAALRPRDSLTHPERCGAAGHTRTAEGQVRHGYDVVAEWLAERAEPIFGLLGNSNLALVARAVSLGAEFHPSRHETGGLCMAAGWALATGRVSFVTTTGGPGATNALTGLTSAVRDRVPMVYLVGDRTLAGGRDSQDIDQPAALRPSGAPYVAVDDGARLIATLEKAFDQAQGGPCPVVVGVPTEILEGPATPQRATEADLPIRPDAAAADPDSVNRAASLLIQAERPVILAGRGAALSRAGPALSRLGAATGALLASSLPAHGIFGSEPYAVGVAGGYCLPRTRRLLQQADVVLAIGASLNHYTTDENRMFPQATVVQADSDPAALGRESPIDIGLVGDGRAIAGALLARAESRERQGVGFRTTEVRTLIANTDYGRDIETRDDPNGVDPRALLRAIDAGLSRRRRIVFDVGHFAAFPCQFLRIEDLGQLIPALGFASIGVGLATAIGVAVGAPDDDVVAVLGDGGLLMSLGELETVARLGSRMIVVVMNDGAYGAEVHQLRRRGLARDVAAYPAVDFAALGRDLGIRSITIRSAADLPNLRPPLAPSESVLIDAHIDPAVISDKFLHH